MGLQTSLAQESTQRLPEIIPNTWGGAHAYCPFLPWGPLYQEKQFNGEETLNSHTELPIPFLKKDKIRGMSQRRSAGKSRAGPGLGVSPRS